MKRLLLVAIFVASHFIINAQAPAGYYTGTSGQTCASLKTNLKNIITTGHVPKTYTDLWTQYTISDVKPREVGSGSAMVIWDIYSDIPGPSNDPYNFTPGSGSGGQQDQGTGGTAEGQFYNREHSVPLSWFSGSTSSPGPATDYHHIFPTDKRVNNVRSNFPYGKVATASFTSLNGSKLGASAVAGITGTVFEPIDSFKGDVARAFLYFVTRYEDNMASWASNPEAAQSFEPNSYPSVDLPYLQLMLTWNDLDPVSQKEIQRNNAAYTYQGNRNPYIDSPQYVYRVWSSNCPGLTALPVDIVYFGGKLAGSLVKLEWMVGNEVNFDSYEIEKSINGTYYKTIGVVKASNLRQYQFADNVESNRGQRVYYRIKKVDRNGSFKYSEVFSVHIPFNNKFSVYPNPASSFIQLQLNNNINGMVSIKITDITGRVASEKIVKVNGSNIQLSTDALSNGTYFITVNINGESYLQKVVISK